MLKKPIYILGHTPLAYYLYSKLTSTGEDVFLLSQTNNPTTVSIKDSLFAKKCELRIEKSMQDSPQMLIITCPPQDLNAAIVNLSSQKIGSTPIVLFTMLKNIEYLRDILGRNIYTAFFDGFLEEQNNKIITHGFNPKINIHANMDVAFDKNVVSIFQKSGIKTVPHINNKELFWQSFIPYAACSLASADYNKKTLYILDDKTQNAEIKNLIHELCNLAKHDGVEINESWVYKKALQTPEEYSFPLHLAIVKNKYSDLNNLSNIIGAHASTPHLCKIIKNLYKKVL